MAQMKTVNEGTVGVVSVDGFGRAVTCFTDHSLYQFLSQPPQWVLHATRFEFEDGSEAVCLEPGVYQDPGTGEVFKA